MSLPLFHFFIFDKNFTVFLTRLCCISTLDYQRIHYPLNVEDVHILNAKYGVLITVFAVSCHMEFAHYVTVHSKIPYYYMQWEDYVNKLSFISIRQVEDNYFLLKISNIFDTQLKLCTPIN